MAFTPTLPASASAALTEAAQYGQARRLVFTPEAYGAKRDGQKVADGAMTNTSAVLTSASGRFASTDVGKAIVVRNAGIGGAHLSTTIASFQSATQVTLATTASTTVTGSFLTWGTDDSAAITAASNAAVAAAIADGSYYAEVIFSSGIYIASRATQKGGATRGNAQIPLPILEPGVGEKVVLTWRGTADASTFGHWNQLVPQKSGAVIYSTLMGQTSDATWKSPSIIGGPTVDLVSTEYFSNMKFVVHGVMLVAPKNPSMIGLDARRLAQCDTPNMGLAADDRPNSLITTATDQGGIGIYYPAINNNDSCNVGVVSVEGFYYAYGFSDHLSAQRMLAVYCNTAFFINAPNGQAMHGSTIGYASVEGCASVLETNASFPYPLVIDNLNVEGITSTVFKDSSNGLRGYIGYANDDQTDPSVTGCANIKIINLNRLRGTITAPSLPATTVATTPIFKDAAVVVSGGTVTAITVDGVATGLTSGTVIVPSGKSISVTYSVAPTWKWWLL